MNQITSNQATLLNLSFANIRGLCSNFVVCESLIESNSPDTTPLHQTNFEDQIHSSNFTDRGYL